MSKKTGINGNTSLTDLIKFAKDNDQELLITSRGIKLQPISKIKEQIEEDIYSLETLPNFPTAFGKGLKRFSEFGKVPKEKNSKELDTQISIIKMEILDIIPQELTSEHGENFLIRIIPFNRIKVISYKNSDKIIYIELPDGKRKYYHEI